MTLTEILIARAILILKGFGDRYDFYAGRYALDGRQLNVYHEGSHQKLVLKFDDGAGIAFENITFADILSLQTDPPKEVIQPPGADIELDVQTFNNLDGVTPIKETYTKAFEETHTNIDSLMAGLEVGIKTSAGVDAGGANFSTELSVTAKTEFTRTNEVSKTASRSLSREIEVPVGVRLEVEGKRQTKRYTQQVRGEAAIKHSVHIWSAADVSTAFGLGGRNGVDVSYPDISDVIRVMKGEGHYGSDYFTKEFKERPERPDLIAELEAGSPFKYVIDYPSVEVNEITERVLEDRRQAA